MRKKLSVGETVNCLFLFCVAFICLYPVWYVFVYALSDPSQVPAGEAIWYPHGFTLDTIEYVLTMPRIGRAYLNTFQLVVGGTLASLCVTTLYAYPIASRVAGYKFLSLFTLFPMLFHGGMIPTFLVVRSTGLLNSLWASLVGFGSNGLVNPFYVFVMIKFFQSIPDSLKESARIDGAGEFTILWRIILPMSKPILASISLFYGVFLWNIFLEPIIYLYDSAKCPVQVILRELLAVQGESEFAAEITLAGMTGESVRMATVVIVILPIILVYPFLQKYFAKGMLVGSIKG